MLAASRVCGFASGTNRVHFICPLTRLWEAPAKYEAIRELFLPITRLSIRRRLCLCLCVGSVSSVVVVWCRWCRCVLCVSAVALCRYILVVRVLFLGL